MKIIKRQKLIQLLQQTKDEELSSRNMEALFKRFADDYFVEGCNMVLATTGEEINANTVYAINWI